MDGKLMKETGITVKEVAGYLGVSEYTIRDLARRKCIPHYRVGGRILFRQMKIQEWLTKQEEENMIGLDV